MPYFYLEEAESLLVDAFASIDLVADLRRQGGHIQSVSPEQPSDRKEGSWCIMMDIMF